MDGMVLGDLDFIISKVAYKDWKFHTGMMGDGYYLQLRIPIEGNEWSGRKWYISSHATKTEVVQTALKAVLTAEEHEAREHFTYWGKVIFGPHLDVDALLVSLPPIHKRMPVVP